MAVAGYGEQAAGPERDMGLFSKKVNQVKLQDQLSRLREIGIRRNAGTEESDLFVFQTREELEEKPFKELAERMGMEIEREPWTPISVRLWMCDFERAEDHGAYKDVLRRLERMTASALSLSGIEDYVDVDEGVAWLQFDHSGVTVRWDLEVTDDWLDPEILVKYDTLLARSGSPLRLYMARAADYGQCAFLGAFTREHQQRFTKLTGIKMGPVD